MINLYQGDCLEVLRTFPDNSVEAVVTDPPYGLAFMNKKWDYDVPSTAIWKEVLRVLKPGRHLLSFMGSGTTGVACKNFQVEFVGIEREEAYVQIAKARTA